MRMHSMLAHYVVKFSHISSLVFNSFFEVQLTNNQNVHFHCYRLPFNYSTPITYPIAHTLQCLQTYWFLNYQGIGLCLYIGICFLIITLINEVKRELKNLSEMNKAEQNRDEIRKKFGEFIQLHAETKQLSFY